MSRRPLPADWSRFGGIEPRAWLCVGKGYSREEIKGGLLANGVGLSANSVLDVSGIATRVVQAARPGFDTGRLLGPFARQEVLRRLLQAPQISARCPELRRLKRNRTFFKKLDQSIQSGRMGFAHADEEQVLEERLQERIGPSQVRSELRLLSLAWEAWLEARGLWDEVRLLREAVLVLDCGGVPAWPEEIAVLRLGRPEALEEALWARVSAQVPVREIRPDSDSGTQASWSWERWHTLDDAADALAQELKAWGGFAERPVAVVIPDQPALRRSLVRALRQAGVPLGDPRDPTRLRWDEALKWALLPLQTVASNFDRDTVVGWLGPSSPKAIQEIYARGIRDQLEAYQGGGLTEVHARLQALAQSFGGKRSLAQLQEAHLEYLRREAGTLGERWVAVRFCESLWKSLADDFAQIEEEGARELRAPLRFWLERIQARVDDGSPPVDYARPRFGVQLYRLSQAPLEPFDRVELLAPPPQWLNGEAEGDYWFSDREREALAQEFGIRSGERTRLERESSFRLWWAAAREIRIRDSHYEWDGRERESLLPLLTLLGLGGGPDAPEPEPREMGSHPRWQASYGPPPALSHQEIELGPDPSRISRTSGLPEVRATELDRVSRCSFQALAQSRWKLHDLRLPEPDLWPDQKGNVLHRAVHLLVESRQGHEGFGLTPARALDQAWEDEKPRGLIRGRRLAEHARRKLLPVLETFCAKELEYAKRSGARVHSLEGPELRLDFPEFTVLGRPDRIDEHDDGLFVLDYKSSSALAKGRQMIDLGYRLQLPFYAVAARRQLGKPAVGVQFVELNRKGARSQGIFFKKWNGKNPGCLTSTTARSTSLVPEHPEDVWPRIEEQIQLQLRDYLSGRFRALPKDKKECDSCSFMDLCGFRRKLAPNGAEAGEEESS